MRRKVDTLRPPLTAAAAPPPPFNDPQPILSAVPDALVPAPTPPRPIASGSEGWGPLAFGHPDAAQRPGHSSVPPVFSSGLPPPTHPIQRPAFHSEADDDLGGIRSGPSTSSDDPFSSRRPRGRVGGWIVALVLLLAVGVVGWAVAKPYLANRDAAAVAQLDPRAQALLSQGERAMADGNLEAAQEAFDKASALAEKDVRVLLDQARLIAAKADVPWLGLRLLAPEATEETRTIKAQLDDWIPRARHSADDAWAAAPADLAAERAVVDALRLSGDRPGARSHVAKLAGQASQPETAYVLAMLDLAESAPLWTTVIERLRLAAAAEGNAGRAQAALVYALAASGDAGGAKAELTKLDALVRPYPLLPTLHTFLSRTGSASTAALGSVTRPAATGPASAASPGMTGGATGGVASVVPDVSGRGQGSPAIPAHRTPLAVGPTAGEPASAARVGMQQAAQALKRADFNQARQIYQAIVERNPNDSEAITGLGDVARVQGDSAGAIVAYRRAIGVNPSYLPALLGLADAQWTGTDRPSAIRAYADIVDRFPEGTYPAYVARRAASASAEPPPPSTPAGESAPTAPGSDTASPAPAPAESSP